MATKLFTRSFNGGVISPEMWGRLDDIKNNTGLAICRNFIPLPQGPIVNRPGLQFVREVADSTKFTRLLPFRFSSTQTSVIEAGEAYFRFHTFGGTLLTPTTGLSAWDVATPYAVGDLVTKGGSTWYCTAVTTGDDPETPANQYGAAPVITATWVETVAQQATPPAGYTNVGSTLPTQAVIGQLVYIEIITYEYLWIYDPYQFEGIGGLDVVETIQYVGYTGTANSSPSGFWYEMPAVYQIPSPYAELDLADLHYVQSGDVLTIVHPNYKPRELRRLGATTWVLAEITFGSTLAAPTIASVTPTLASSPSDTQVYSYVATNVTDDQLDESVASAAVTATNQLFDTGALNTITFSTAARRNVYKQSAGQFGFIGQTTSTTLIDDNIAADISRTPPLNQNPFATDYPSAVCYYEQRRVFAGTPNFPQTFWMTKVGAESNFDYSIPIRDDDGISIKIAAREANTIRNAVVVGDLLLLTESAEWRISSAGDIMTPTTVTARPQAYIGSSNVQPVTVNTGAIYAAARGGHVRVLGYEFDVQSYVSLDLSLRAAHLFDYKNVTDLAYAKGPIPIVWAVSSDGRLLGMTYVPEQQVYAWHVHDTDGTFESIAVVGEGNDDILYTVLRRPVFNAGTGYATAPTVAFSGGGGSGAAATATVLNGVVTGITVTNGGTGYTSAPTVSFSGGGGSGAAATATIAAGAVTAVTRTTTQKRYVERLASRYFSSLKDAFFVDSGLTYSGSPATVISGLSHLEGRPVFALADGAVVADLVVTGGQVTLPKAASLVHVGLAILSDMQTLPLAIEGLDGFGQGRVKNINQVYLRVYQSSGIYAGPSVDDLTEAKIRTTEPYGSPPSLQTAEVDIVIQPSWSRDGQIVVRQVDPVPLTIVSATLELQFGG